ARDREARRQIPDRTEQILRRSLLCAWRGQELWDRDQCRRFQLVEKVASSAWPECQCHNRCRGRGHQGEALRVPIILFLLPRRQAVLLSDRKAAETNHDRLRVNNSEQIPWQFSPPEYYSYGCNLKRWDSGCTYCSYRRGSRRFS